MCQRRVKMDMALTSSYHRCSRKSSYRQRGEMTKSWHQTTSRWRMKSKNCWDNKNKSSLRLSFRTGRRKKNGKRKTVQSSSRYRNNYLLVTSTLSPHSLAALFSYEPVLAPLFWYHRVMAFTRFPLRRENRSLDSKLSVRSPLVRSQSRLFSGTERIDRAKQDEERESGRWKEEKELAICHKVLESPKKRLHLGVPVSNPPIAEKEQARANLIHINAKPLTHCQMLVVLRLFDVRH